MPTLTHKSQNYEIRPDIQRFEWGDATIVDEVASCSFGNMYLATYLTNKQVVIKKLREQDRESKETFLKEAGLLQKLKEKRNTAIIDFFGLCTDPYAIMMEYLYFDFNPFGVDKKVSSL
jgi:serine/threonine protein kinase